MEKRTFFAFLLVIGFFLLWSRSQPNQSAQDIDRQKVKHEKTEKEKKEAFPPPDESGLLPAPGTNELKKARVGGYYISYSPTGGYIKSIAAGREEEILPFGNFGFQPGKKNIEYRAQVGSDSISFYRNGTLSKKFTFGENTLKIKPDPGSSILLFSFPVNVRLSRISQRYYETFYKQAGTVKRAHPGKIKTQAYPGVEFAGARSRYYALSLLKGDYDIKWEKNDKTANLYLENTPSVVSLYIGPQISHQLEPYGLGGIVYYGFWHFLATAIINILYFFYGFLHNWGLSIILFSLSAYLVLFPFTSKSTKAMKKMQEIQPMMQELKEKHKDNPQKMQKETVALYKKHKVNPLGGCLPLLFQFPIIIAFYQVVFRFARLKGASFLWIKDLAMPDHLFKLPFTIPVVGVEYFNLFPILVMALGIIQQHISSASSNPQQKKIGLFMGVFIGIIFYKFPSALVLYWFVQNLLTLIYQARLKKARV